MSNTLRRGDRGLGKTPAGGTAGSFAAHERAAAAPPPPNTSCVCSTNRDGSVTSTLCPTHSDTDPCLTKSLVTGKRRHGTIRNGTCTNCGWTERREQSPVDSVFDRWKAEEIPAWGDGTYTPNEDQFKQMAEEALSNLEHSAHDHRTLAGFDCVRVTHGRKRHSVCVYKDKRLVCPPLEFTDSSVPEVWKITEQYITSWSAKEV